MDNFARIALKHLLAGLLAVGVPILVGVYTFDETFGGRYDVDRNSLSGALVMLAIGSCIGALTFAPLYVLTMKLAGANSLSSSVIISLLLEVVFILGSVWLLPDAPFLNGNGGAQLWAALLGGVAAGILLLNWPDSFVEGKS